MSDSDGPRRRKNVLANRSSAEADDDVVKPHDDAKKSRDNCYDVIRGIWSAVVCRLHRRVDASSLAVFRMLFGESNARIASEMVSDAGGRCHLYHM